MRKIIIVILLVASISLLGCSARQGITQDDLCVKHIRSGESICYNDDKEKVEDILGQGKETITAMLQYEDKLGIIYRYDKVVLINLPAETSGKYKAVVNIGDAKEKVVNTFGEENVFDTNTVYTDFFYDSVAHKYYTFFTYSYNSEERDRNIYVISTRINDEDKVEVMMLGDSYAMTHLK